MTDEDIILTQAELNQAIEILKRSQQTLVFLDSIICPIRKLIGQSREDLKMIQLKNELEMRDIINKAAGHWSLASTPGHIYFTSFDLNEEWFRKNCNAYRYNRETKQFKLF